MVFRREPFKLTTFDDYHLYNDSFISILSEYKTGVNDYDVVNAELVDLGDVIREIKGLTNKAPKFIVSHSESKNCFNKCLSSYDKKVTDLLKECLNL
ncbi:hypothetical protein PRVXH_001303 [Proteinivorax hydrogeniformans]|uniref:Uncharacterized protein n=1 Tax=Proteinivorax hydrogeniformans TaxID=1826727 RepID=A0AAU8HX20_9FIRM